MQRSRGSNKQAANESNSTRKCSRWTPVEDRALITAINDLLDVGGCKADNGQFKNGTWAKVEAIMLRKLPGCDKRAKPHIESRVKLLRRYYDAIAEMLSPTTSDFGWNDEGKFVILGEVSYWLEQLLAAIFFCTLQSHPNAASLRNKSFPFFDELCKIFGKDRAMGNEAASTLDALEELEEEGKDIKAEQVYDLTTEDEVTPSNQNRQIKTPSSTAPTKTKKARTETIEALKDFSSKLEKLSSVMEIASEHIGRLASCFQHESDSAERKMKVTLEVMKIGGVTTTQVLLASMKIALNPLGFNFFFILPDDYRYAHVQGLLLQDQQNNQQNYEQTN
ncbi:hypothetical protein AgCh_025324 [Apium graveolens]